MRQITLPSPSSLSQVSPAMREITLPSPSSLSRVNYTMGSNLQYLWANMADFRFKDFAWLLAYVLKSAIGHMALAYVLKSAIGHMPASWQLSLLAIN